MADAARLVTAEELQRYPDDGYKYELVAGRVIRMSPPGCLHGVVAAGVASMLDQHVRPAKLGVVAVELGVKLATNPDTVRAPDVAFRGTSVVVVIDPDERTVSTYRGQDALVTVSGGDDLDLSDVVPGFRCRVRDIFE